jgi:hypothetical protein
MLSAGICVCERTKAGDGVLRGLFCYSVFMTRSVQLRESVDSPCVKKFGDLYASW